MWLVRSPQPSATVSPAATPPPVTSPDAPTPVPTPTEISARIVLGPRGPDRHAYRLVVDDEDEVTIENRSDVAWVPWGLAAHDAYCHLDSGPTSTSGPCTVGPHQVVRYWVGELILEGGWDIRFAHDGAPLEAIRVPIWFVGGRFEFWVEPRIVIGPDGPTLVGSTTYTLAVDDQDRVTVENQSDVAWVIWGLAKHDVHCRHVSGPFYTSDPCTIGPHEVAHLWVGDVDSASWWSVRFAPEGMEYSQGIPFRIGLDSKP
jgi:hypothetical protein